MKTTAQQIMTKPVATVQTRDFMRDVAAMMTENNMGAAAVLDEKGKPVGVITKTDLARHEREEAGIKTVAKPNERNPPGFQVIEEDVVRNWMTPVIFTAKPETPISEVARKMVRYGIHHVFIRRAATDPIIGIVSSFDILLLVAGLGNKRP